MAIPYLPPEILTNIFLRLDLKTLSSARLVKKCWLQFISSPNFARAHLKSSKEDHGIVFATSDFTPVLGQFSIASSLRKSYSINLVNLDHPKMRQAVCLVGSCNGLVCIITLCFFTNVILWNPCTGEHKELRSLEVVNRAFTYGFGYDESNDDYKVVVLCYVSQNEDRNGDKNYRYEVEVNSLKRNCWKTSVAKFKGRVSGLGKIASGKIHWLAIAEFHRHWRNVIISFDLGSEVFGIVEQPSYGDGRFQIVLDVLEGCICLLSRNRLTHADLWVMKEYGVNESWTKVVTISRIDVFGEFSRLSPCSMLPNGEILLSTSESFAVYNPKDDSFRFTGIVKKSCSEPVIYVPSLVSPLGYWKARDQESKDGTTSIRLSESHLSLLNVL